MTLQERDSAVVRLAGDSGDGVQLAGAQLTHTSALCGNAVWTAPDFPAEIRAPAGSLAGVSAFQVQFGGDVHTPGDRVDLLVAMNPAALKTHLKDLNDSGTLIVNRDAFTPDELAKAGYAADPLADGSLAGRRLLAVPITALTRQAAADRRYGAPPCSASARWTAARTCSRWGWFTGCSSGRWGRRCAGLRRNSPATRPYWKPTAAPSRPAGATAKRPRGCRIASAWGGRRCRRAATATSPATRPWRWAWSPRRGRPGCRCCTPPTRSRRPPTCCTGWSS